MAKIYVPGKRRPNQEALLFRFPNRPGHAPDRVFQGYFRPNWSRSREVTENNDRRWHWVAVFDVAQGGADFRDTWPNEDEEPTDYILLLPIDGKTYSVTFVERVRPTAGGDFLRLYLDMASSIPWRGRVGIEMSGRATWTADFPILPPCGSGVEVQTTFVAEVYIGCDDSETGVPAIPEYFLLEFVTMTYNATNGFWEGSTTITNPFRLPSAEAGELGCEGQTLYLRVGCATASSTADPIIWWDCDPAFGSSGLPNGSLSGANTLATFAPLNSNRLGVPLFGGDYRHIAHISSSISGECPVNTAFGVIGCLCNTDGNPITGNATVTPAFVIRGTHETCNTDEPVEDQYNLSFGGIQTGFVADECDTCLEGNLDSVHRLQYVGDCTWEKAFQMTNCSLINSYSLNMTWAMVVEDDANATLTMTVTGTIGSDAVLVVARWVCDEFHTNAQSRFVFDGYIIRINSPCDFSSLPLLHTNAAMPSCALEGAYAATYRVTGLGQGGSNLQPGDPGWGFSTNGTQNCYVCNLLATAGQFNLTHTEGCTWQGSTTYQCVVNASYSFTATWTLEIEQETQRLTLVLEGSYPPLGGGGGDLSFRNEFRWLPAQVFNRLGQTRYEYDSRTTSGITLCDEMSDQSPIFLSAVL